MCLFTTSFLVLLGLPLCLAPSASTVIHCSPSNYYPLLNLSIPSQSTSRYHVSMSPIHNVYLNSIQHVGNCSSLNFTPHIHPAIHVCKMLLKTILILIVSGATESCTVNRQIRRLTWPMVTLLCRPPRGCKPSGTS